MGNMHSQYFTSGAAAHTPSFVVDTSLDKVLWKRVEETAALSRQAINTRKNLEDVQSILDGFSHVTEVINLRDMSGFSLLQHAIISNQIDIVKYLLHQGADVNIPSCARPLHLAAKLGRVEIVNLLLEYHADPDVLSCVCYPEQHFSSQIVCVPQMDHMHLACGGDVYNPKSVTKERFEFPRYFAIIADSVECVKILEKVQHVNHDGGNNIPDLHLACKLGSKESMDYFLTQSKDSINQSDHTGYTPVMYAMSWNKSLLEVLILNGALLTVKTKSKQTLLHVLLKQYSSNMFEMLKYVLDCGLRMNINQLDNGGNSALNVLLLSLEEHKESMMKTFRDISGNTVVSGSNFTRNIIANSSPSFRHVNSGKQNCFSEMEMQYIQCVNLLLKSGINPNISNRLGNTSLHIVTRLQDTSSSDVDTNLSHASTTTKYLDMQFIHVLLLAILSAKGNVNIVNNSEQSIMSQFIFYCIDAIFMHVQSSQLLPIIDHQVQYFIASVKALHQHGARLYLQVGRSNLGQICYLHALFEVLDEFHSASHLVSRGMNTQHDEMVKSWATRVLRMVRKVAECFLMCGLNPNLCADGTVMQKHFSLLYYKLLTNKPVVDVEDIEDFLRLLLHYGIHIDRSGQHILMTVLRPHTGSGYRQLPCFPLLHLINMIGTKSHNPQKESELLDLLHFLYNALHQGIARQCVRLYLEYDRCIGTAQKNTEFDEYLVLILNTPRKLKQMTAHFVYREIAHMHMANVRKLPIPIVMQNYLGSFHY